MKRNHTRAEWKHFDGNTQYKLRKEREASGDKKINNALLDWRGPVSILASDRRSVCH